MGLLPVTYLAAHWHAILLGMGIVGAPVAVFLYYALRAAAFGQ
jgi:hypothetical protein